MTHPKDIWPWLPVVSQSYTRLKIGQAERALSNLAMVKGLWILTFGDEAQHVNPRDAEHRVLVTHIICSTP